MKPTLKLTEITPTYLAFLDYGGGDFDSMAQRKLIHYREDHKDYEVIHAFPYTNEKHIAIEIEELKIAQKAIAFLKKGKVGKII